MIQNNIFDVGTAQTHMVILCSVLPANYFIGNQKKTADTILALNKVLKVMLRQMIFHMSITTQLWLTIGLPLVYSNDGVHPNKAGYQLMEPIVERIIALYV
jgi:lysophospholipase L1-like esterase